VITIQQIYSQTSEIQISPALATAMKNIRRYSKEHAGAVYSVFSPPLNVVIGNSGQSLVEYELALQFSQLGGDMLSLLGLREL